uniref:DP2 n=1 Tax=Arundo donax TaxID=35708 RepID=A0A0A9A587_ARUDO
MLENTHCPRFFLNKTCTFLYAHTTAVTLTCQLLSRVATTSILAKKKHGMVVRQMSQSLDMIAMLKSIFL